jgi:hypothetical protein
LFTSVFLGGGGERSLASRISEPKVLLLERQYV